MTKNCIIIGVAGASASGKSLLARTIVRELASEHVIIISEDSYYKDTPELSLEERKKVNYDHPDAFDHALLYKHLQKMQLGETIQVPIYNHTEYAREENTRAVGKHSIIVLEGVLLFAESQLRRLMDIKIYLDTPLDICLIRRLKRDVIERGRNFDSVLEQYETTVRPMYFQFVEPSKRHADIIVPHGGENRIAIDMITAKMRELLRTN